MSSIDIATPEGRITTPEGLARYNDKVVDQTVKEAKERRAGVSERAEKVITEAMEGEGKPYLKSQQVGRRYFFGMGFEPKKKG